MDKAHDGENSGNTHNLNKCHSHWFHLPLQKRGMWSKQ
jgi:hypothetical protein